MEDEKYTNKEINRSIGIEYFREAVRMGRATDSFKKRMIIINYEKDIVSLFEEKGNLDNLEIEGLNESDKKILENIIKKGFLRAENKD